VGQKVNHSSPSHPNTQVKNEWSYASTPYVLSGGTQRQLYLSLSTVIFLTVISIPTPRLRMSEAMLPLPMCSLEVHSDNFTFHFLPPFSSQLFPSQHPG